MKVFLAVILAITLVAFSASAIEFTPGLRVYNMKVITPELSYRLGDFSLSTFNAHGFQIDGQYHILLNYHLELIKLDSGASLQIYSGVGLNALVENFQVKKMGLEGVIGLRNVTPELGSFWIDWIVGPQLNVFSFGTDFKILPWLDSFLGD